jgi:hypothetical protein
MDQVFFTSRRPSDFVLALSQDEKKHRALERTSGSDSNQQTAHPDRSGVMDDQSEHYLTAAYTKAFGKRDEAEWDPSLGFSANRARIVKLYDYYRDAYLANPDSFLWAGLARLAGGVVVSGLDLLFPDPGVDTVGFVQIGKNIFHDLAWQLEAFLDDPAIALKLAAQRDTEAPARVSYAGAWTKITTGDPVQIAAGNRDLLENEQFSIIQPLYDQIKSQASLGMASPFTNSVHPYHRDFLVDLPSGDVTVADDRWNWITLPGGMWEKWAERHGTDTLPVEMSKEERTRLVSLSLDDIMRRNFGTLDQSLLPPGADDEG